MRPVVGVHDRAGLASVASPDGHLQGVDDELGTEVISDRPADDATREGIDHSRQVDLALCRRVLGDVAHPEGIGPVDGELAVDEVFARAPLRVTPGREVLLPAIDPLDPRLSHQALDALFSDVDALA